MALFVSSPARARPATNTPRSNPLTMMGTPCREKTQHAVTVQGSVVTTQCQRTLRDGANEIKI